MITQEQEVSKEKKDKQSQEVGRKLCIWLDAQTSAMLDEILEKYRKETYTSIITKAIRNLYDITCRALNRRH